MNRVVKADLVRKVNSLNRRFKLTDKTNVKFFLSQAYGGYNIVLRSNYSGGQHTLRGLSGHDTARKTLEAVNRLSTVELNREIKRAREHVTRMGKPRKR